MRWRQGTGFIRTGIACWWFSTFISTFAPESTWSCTGSASCAGSGGLLTSTGGRETLRSAVEPEDLGSCVFAGGLSGDESPRFTRAGRKIHSRLRGFGWDCLFPGAKYR